ncbi:MAG: recombinase zinc beta ribbon domain-containing protein [bacterium]|nr:recombinase zinc beta ribbon domain-containing protein [bacterium]
MLKNPFYYGDFVWAGERYRGNHEPLISRDLYDRVQIVLGRGGHPRTRTRDFAFKGILKCAKCGCAIVGELKKGKYIYYHCTSAKGRCDQPYIREESLVEAMGDTLRSIQVTPSIVQDIVRALQDFHSTEREHSETEMKRLRARQTDLQRRLDKAYEDRLDEVIDQGYWHEVSTKWRSEQDSISRRIDALRTANRGSVDFALEILELSQEAYSLYLSGNTEGKRQLLNSVLSNCTLDGLTVTPTYKKPFGYIAEGLDLQLKLPRLDSNQRPAD